MAQGILSIKIRADASPLERALKMAGRDMTAFSQKALAIGRGITLGFTAPVVAMGSSFLTAAASMDQLSRGLTAIMGDSSSAAKELDKLKESAKLPGLAFEEAVRGSIRLQSVGLKADEARKVLETFGKAIATTGGGAVELEAVQYQMTQMISKNKILAEDFKPIQSAVPLIGKAMQQAFGTNNIEAVRDLGIGAKEFALRLTESLKILPEVQNSTGGIRNSFDNLKDSLKFASAEMGKVILKNIDLDAIINEVVSSLSRLTEYFGGLSDSQQKTILNTIRNIAVFGGLSWIVGQLGSSLGTLTYVFGQVIEKLIRYDKVSRTISLTTGGIIVLAASLIAVIYSIGNAYYETTKPIDTFNDYLSVGAKNANKEANEFNYLIETLKNVNTSSTTRQKVLEELNTKYGEYLPKLLSEKTSLQEIDSAQKDANESLKTRFKLLAQEGVREKQLKKKIELEGKLAELEKKRANQEVKVSTGLTTGLDLSAGVINYDTVSGDINKLKTDIEKITAAYDKTLETISELNIEQEKNQKIINDKKIKNLEWQIQDLNLAIEVSTREYGKNNNGAKLLKEKLAELELQYQKLTGQTEQFGNTIITNTNKTEKALGPYELLKKKLSDIESQYADLVTTQNVNSESAKKLKEQYGKTADELTRIETAIDNLKRKGFDVTRLGQFKLPKETGFEDIFPPDLVKRIEKTFGFVDGKTKQTRELGIKTAPEVTEAVLLQPQKIDIDTSSIEKVKEGAENIKASIKEITNIINQDFGKALGAGFEAFGTALASGENAIASFGKAFLDTMLDVISMTLKALLAQITLKEAIKGGGIGSVIGLGLGLAAVSALKGLLAKTKLAKGGLAFGPTMATVGDNPNSRFDPEVIAPLSKLKSMLVDSNNNMPYMLTTRVSGSDLIFMMQKANNVNQRIR